MLGSQMLDAKLQDNNGKSDKDACNSKSEHVSTKDWTSSEEKKFFLKRRFGSPRVLSKSIPRRNRSLLRYSINRSLNLDITSSRKDDRSQSPNSSLDNSFDLSKSSRDLSRSAKIMRALSFNHDLFCHRNANIKKSLTFESTPSPEKNSSSSLDGSTHTDSKVNTPSPTLDKFLRLSTSSTDSSSSILLIASSESIDENQNQTPQQNRKVFKISSDSTSNSKEDTSKSGRSSGSTSLLRSNLKERIDNIIHTITPGLRSLKRDDRVHGYGMVASTPRNLFKEFNEDECSRPCTPENMIRLIPESISDIKKSHKKERLYNHGEQPFTRQMNVSVENGNPRTKATIELLKIADTSTSGSYDASSSDQYQKKATSVKKALVYDSNDELSDTGSISDYVAVQKTTPGDSSDCGMYEENVQNIDSISPSSSHHNDKEEDRSDEDIHDMEECRPVLKEESSNIRNIDIVERGNRTVSFESNPTTSQDLNGAVTPENHINILQSILTESIKESHKKMKHENRKVLFKSKILHKTKSEISIQDIQDSNDNLCEDMESKPIDTTLSPQNSDRPSTPTNINSSRLLLSQYNSIKKSHRKDKRDVNRRIRGLVRCYNEYRKKNVSSLQNNKYEEENTSKILFTNESLLLPRSSPDVSPSKRKKSMDVSLQSGMRKSPNSSASLSLGSENTNDEFKIYTPIRRRMPSTEDCVTNCVCADETSLKKDETTQAASKEIDFSRCVTPVARYSHPSNVKSRGNESLTNGRCANAENLKNNVNNVSDSGPADTAHLTGDNGRSTPINMSTTELLCNIDSIKKSHKKDKHDRIIHKRQIFGKKQSYIKEAENINSSNNRNTLKEDAIPSLKLSLDVDSHCAEVRACSNTSNDDDKSCEIIVRDDSQPSTSRGNDSTQDKNVKQSKLLNTTPPNCLNRLNLIKLLQTTSIKKSHKKERDCNAQAKYILMSEQHDESDDGSIFDEEDRLTSLESFGLCQDNGNEKIHS